MAGRSSLLGNTPLCCLYNIERKDSKDDEENRMMDVVYEVRLSNVVCVKRKSKPGVLTNWKS